MIRENRRDMFLFLLLLNLAVYISFQSWSTIFNNFAVENAGIDGFYMGLTQSVREIPGFLSLLVILAIVVLPEHKLAVVSLIVLGLGIAVTGYLPTPMGVIVSTLIMSFGFHFFETVNQSLTLQYFNKLETPLVLSRLRSVAAGGNIAAGVLVIVLLKFMEYKYIFLITGMLAVAAGLYCLKLNPVDSSLPVQKKKLQLKWKYWLYYALTFLSGARRQVFTAFAVFLMVEKFGFSTKEIAILFIVNNMVSFFFNPVIGRMINKYGERRLLSIEYSTLVFVFIGYAFLDSKILVALLYIVDNLVYSFVISIRTFYQKIAEPEDFANGSAMGFTINHIAAVFIPFAGGILWMIDKRIPFIVAAVLTLMSLGLTQLIPSHLQKHQKA
ncbi:MFS transporter [Seleniivibrio woodruffii]|uniref:Putative MFS family arabinose efflux permease n=1 Tax=Seleniivibrio woodruffii TaxID=1078050 RepID=A0A4R1K8W2_9BACT|nr:MFS transporter [Seleniivibrio woodruffii]TCK60806.1 putative MFS family arabinose efflux permease [Seleniivibrio woodruffii]TVZ36436.1 putative MFS family arabinose efflux permease [Seleniivibrio woodruffii]